MVNEQKNEIKKEKWISQRKTLIYIHTYINTHPRTRKHIYIHIHICTYTHYLLFKSDSTFKACLKVFKLFVFLIESDKLFHIE